MSADATDLAAELASVGTVSSEMPQAVRRLAVRQAPAIERMRVNGLATFPLSGQILAVLDVIVVNLWFRADAFLLTLGRVKKATFVGAVS